VQSFTTVLSNLDKFAHLGGFSGSSGGRGGFDPKTSNNGVLADAAAFNKEMKALFLGIGSVEGPGTKNFSEALTKAGIKNAYFESAGTAHEWLTWRRCLYDFAPRLFKQAAGRRNKRVFALDRRQRRNRVEKRSISRKSFPEILLAAALTAPAWAQTGVPVEKRIVVTVDARKTRHSMLPYF
jgi:hypothetical protein